MAKRRYALNNMQKKSQSAKAKVAVARPRATKSHQQQPTTLLARAKATVTQWGEKIADNRYAGPVVKSRRVQLFAKWFGLPVFLYYVLFYIISPHYWGHFTDGFFLDKGDGYQNVWNFWWIDWSITQLHQHPWFTNYLHWPHGMTLITQTMNPFNGLVILPFVHLFDLSLIQSVNSMVMFSYIMSGVTMFWLVHYLNKSYAVAILAGAMYAFSSYHVAHGIGHMQLISMEWVPLFLLAWWRLLEKPSYKMAVGAGLALFLVALCDYYYVFYSVVAAAIIGGYVLYKRDLKITKLNIKIFATFVGVCLVLVAPFFYKLSQLNKNDPLSGAHDAVAFSLDPFMAVIPGGNWHWAELTKAIWQPWPYSAESSMFLGLTIIVPLILLIVWWRKRSFKLPKWMNVWWIIFFTFFVLSLGPHLRIGTHVLNSVPLPYAWLTKLIPTLEISGMPMRMIFMTMLSGIVLASFVFRRIDLRSRRGKYLMAAIAAVFIIEVYPNPLPLSYPGPAPRYVELLRDLPQKSGTGVIDNAATTGSDALYYQTIHHKPMAFGYTTRTTKSVDERNFHIFADIEQGRQGNLCDLYHIRYFATQQYYNQGFPIIYQDPTSKIHIYDMKNGDGC